MLRRFGWPLALLAVLLAVCLIRRDIAPPGSERPGATASLTKVRTPGASKPGMSWKDFTEALAEPDDVVRLAALRRLANSFATSDPERALTLIEQIEEGEAVPWIAQSALPQETKDALLKSAKPE